jgi:hypothetical protein
MPNILPVTLVQGIGSRSAALGLFVRTLTIQLFVYPASTHAGWLALAMANIARGPGRILIDRLIGCKQGQPGPA